MTPVLKQLHWLKVRERIRCKVLILAHKSFYETAPQYLTLYDPGGGGALKAPLRFFALAHLILELHYCALGTFPKK